VEVREWGVNPDTGHLDINDLKNLLDKKVKLVCFPHCSNIVGEINPVKEIVKLVRDAGAYSCVDGVSYAPHGFPNIGDLQPDVYLFSTYKTYGPHQGIMVLSERLNSALPNQAHYFNADYPTRRFTPAGPDHAQIAACAGMADYFDLLYDHHFEPQADAAKRGEAVHDLLRSHEVNILQPLLDNLSSRNSVRLLGPDDANKRAPTVAVEVSSNAFDIAKNLSKEGINAGGGDFYAVRLLDALGVDRKNGALRLSFVHYTSEEEVSHLIKILDKVL
jgi:selenocysteine lyase/cysteine desulfurase